MAHQTPNDPMAKYVLIGGSVLLVLAVAVLATNLFRTVEKNSTKGAGDTSMQMAAADDNLKPIGDVNAVDKTVVKAARSGDAVFNAVCTSCHSAGVLGAPKIDDKAAWEPRVGQGLKTLLDHASNGIRSMPARGGDPTITDEELVNAIVYMTGKAGFDLSADAKALLPAGAAPAAAPASAPAADQAAAPAQEAAPAADQAAAPAQEAAPAADQAAAPAQEAAPVQDAPAAADQAAAPAQEAAPAAPVQEAAPAADQASAPAPETAPAATAIDGEKVYKSICFSCHDVGVAGSPKLGDKEAWASRIATGKDALYNAALHGKNAMPAKGGNPALSDDEVKAAVDFMVGKVQ